MCKNDMSEAAMLREIIRERDAEISALKAQVKELEDKHWGECLQIAKYDDEADKAADVIAEVLALLESGAIGKEAET